MSAKEILQQCHDQSQAQTVILRGACHDCGAGVAVQSTIIDAEGRVQITGGALYEGEGRPFFKCQGCFDAKPELTDFRRCEVYSRVVGYLTPVSGWNGGKKAEFAMRMPYRSEGVSNAGSLIPGRMQGCG